MANAIRKLIDEEMEYPLEYVCNAILLEMKK
jgi:hypothetical protein